MWIDEEWKNSSCSLAPALVSLYRYSVSTVVNSDIHVEPHTGSLDTNAGMGMAQWTIQTEDAVPGSQARRGVNLWPSSPPLSRSLIPFCGILTQSPLRLELELLLIFSLSDRLLL